MFRARVLARTLLYVFLVTSTTLYVFSNYVEYVYSITCTCTVGRVLFYLRRYEGSCYDSLVPY